LIVIGVDPGSNATGYAIIECGSSKIKVLEYGVIRTIQKSPLPEKLHKIHASLTYLFKHYKPGHLALETAFVAKYPQAALILGHTRGAIMVAAQSCGLEIFEYEPRLVKSSVTGTGRASKNQVAGMIQRHLSLKEIPKPQDASDALAVAFCHMLRSNGI